jgi:hypothetical protein
VQVVLYTRHEIISCARGEQVDRKEMGWIWRFIRCQGAPRMKRKTRAMRSNHVGCDGDSESETGETSGWFPLGRPPKRSTATRARMASLTLEQGNPTDT